MLQFTHVDGRDVGEIKLFALSTCGWCKKTREFLSDKNIAYSYIYVDLLDDDQMQEALTIQRKYNSKGSFPTIVIDDTRTIIGYDLPELELLAEEKAYA